MIPQRQCFIHLYCTKVFGKEGGNEFCNGGDVDLYLVEVQDPQGSYTGNDLLHPFLVHVL